MGGVLCAVFFVFALILWVWKGLKSEKVYSFVEFFALHSKGVSPMIYDVVLRGRENNGIRFIALVCTGFTFNIFTTFGFWMLTMMLFPSMYK